jgi:hypothetical protein
MPVWHTTEYTAKNAPKAIFIGVILLFYKAGSTVLSLWVLLTRSGIRLFMVGL